jgi:hypothetical protein
MSKNNIFCVKNKRGVDAIVSYVLLITLGLSLAIFVFNWLRDYVPKEIDEVKCPEGVSLIIADKTIDQSGKILNLTVQNRGRFNVSGFFLRANNVTEPNFGVYLINDDDFVVGVGEKKSVSINYSNYSLNNENFTYMGDLKIIEVQPFVYQKGHPSKIPCDSISKIVNS